MKGAVSSLALLIMGALGTAALEAGIDKGELHCSREKGSEVLRAEKGDFGSIVSGGYPGNYSTAGRTGLRCQIHIRVCSTCRLRLQLQELTFSSCVTQARRGRPNRGRCLDGCDHIHLHEVDPPYDEKTHRDYFLEDEGDQYTSISGSLKIRHCAGNTSTEDGHRFKISYKVIDKNELHQGLADYGGGGATGHVISPNFPHGYALNSETFTFTIHNLDPYGYIRLTFDDWDIAPETQVTIYDGVTSDTQSSLLTRRARSVIMSQTNMLVLVLSTGSRSNDCCFHTGFKAVYTFVSDRNWPDRPDSSCSESHPLQSGGVISFTGSNSAEPKFYDCVWLIKRYSSLNTADAAVLRLREVLLGDGWLNNGRRNSLEIRHGVTSQAPLMARYTAHNLTDIRVTWQAPQGLYIRLQGGFSDTDKLSFMFTAVKNVTEDGCPGFFDFLCSNLLCIDQELICDGADHCGDASDERPALDCTVSSLWKQGYGFKWNMPYVGGSPGSTAIPSSPPCDGVVCGRLCLRLDQVCDGRVDCVDRLDEDSCAHTSSPDRNSNQASSIKSSWLLILITIVLGFFTLQDVT